MSKPKSNAKTKTYTNLIIFLLFQRSYIDPMSDFYPASHSIILMHNHVRGIYLVIMEAIKGMPSETIEVIILQVQDYKHCGTKPRENIRTTI